MSVSLDVQSSSTPLNIKSILKPKCRISDDQRIKLIENLPEIGLLDSNLQEEEDLLTASRVQELMVKREEELCAAKPVQDLKLPNLLIPPSILHENFYPLQERVLDWALVAFGCVISAIAINALFLRSYT